ncbi:MAG TPA: hypothetical protein VF773_02170 [Verrucomicrobiae bacterium]
MENAVASIPSRIKTAVAAFQKGQCSISNERVFGLNARVQNESDFGNYVEAFNELENLPPEHRASVEVMELRCRIYRKLEKWWELETVAAGCLASTKDLERIPFACDLAWALLKQSKPDDAKAALGKVPYTCCPELLFTGACVTCGLVIWNSLGVCFRTRLRSASIPTR